MKQRTRKRISRAVAKQSREIKRLQNENKSLHRRYKKVSKRCERLQSKQNNTSNQTTPYQNKTANEDNQEPSVTKDAALSFSTPRKRVATDLREAGMSPRKVPRKIRQTLLLGNVLSEEISDSRKQNGKKGRKVIASILSGNILRKYKLKRLLNKNTGLT